MTNTLSSKQILPQSAALVAGGNGSGNDPTTGKPTVKSEVSSSDNLVVPPKFPK
ncbi:hypothetical protein [Pseudoalteromonas xiamenensis]